MLSNLFNPIRIGILQVELSHYKRENKWLWQQLAELNADRNEGWSAAAYWQREAGGHVERLRAGGLL